MVAVYEYKDIDQVLAGIRQQIIDSVEYCYNTFPAFSSPEEMFYYFKKRTTFRDDIDPDTGKPAEYLPTVKTLFENNVHGIPGAGDCDDFTILAIANFIAQGWGDMDIVLAGRTKLRPVHIYAYITWDGYTHTFDLTESRYDQERYYPLRQVLPQTFYN